MDMMNCGGLRAISSFDVFNAFSIALDIAEGSNIGHAKRVAYTAIRLSRHLGLSEDEIQIVYYSAIMHDVGVGNSRLEAYKDNNRKLVHAVQGEEIIKTLPLDPRVGKTIRYHHEQWDGKGPFQLSGDEIPLPSQIVYFADQFDILFTRHDNYADARKKYIDAIKDMKGKELNPLITEAFCDLGMAERFWLDYQFESFNEIFNRIAPRDAMTIELISLETIAETFAKIIDNNSAFTHNHSRGIAERIKNTTVFLKFDTLTQQKAYIAGLLHDLGKLAVPTRILDKVGALTPLERDIINTHTYYTRLILDQIPGLQDIAGWASNHHERLDGKGYPERLTGDKLDRMSRLLCICDIYQALTEDRPYRKGMTDSQAWKIIDNMVDSGGLCAEARDDVKNAQGK